MKKAAIKQCPGGMYFCSERAETLKPIPFEDLPEDEQNALLEELTKEILKLNSQT